MTEKQPGMSDERLAQIRALAGTMTRYIKRSTPGLSYRLLWGLSDAVDEIERQRAELAAKDAENERLRAAHTELTERHDYCNERLDCYNAGPVWEHSTGCPRRIAWDALNPEPAPCPHGRMARTECWQCDGTPDPEPVPCEASGCESPATTHDADGMLLCRECGEELVASGEPAP